MNGQNRTVSTLATLLLFDIDGTLIRKSKAARIAFARALHSCLGVQVDLSSLQIAGMTDFMIITQIFKEHGIDDKRVDLEVLLGWYIHHLAITLRFDRGQVCPGVRRLLDFLAPEKSTAIALGTGNLAQSARMKLAAHGLDVYFATGGFGDDGLEREAVIAAAIAKAQTYYGRHFHRVAVVGDTPHDVVSAQANKVHSIGVATGPYDLAALQQAGATLVFPDLSQTEAVIQEIDSLPSSNHLR